MFARLHDLSIVKGLAFSGAVIFAGTPNPRESLGNREKKTIRPQNSDFWKVNNPAHSNVKYWFKPRSRHLGLATLPPEPNPTQNRVNSDAVFQRMKNHNRTPNRPRTPSCHWLVRVTVGHNNSRGKGWDLASCQKLSRCIYFKYLTFHAVARVCVWVGAGPTLSLYRTR